jgi:hypothetical protein
VKFAQIDGSPVHDRLAYTAQRSDDLFDSPHVQLINHAAKQTS